ncbi:TlpA disulfide reductase family protein [uncultured Marinobacter sp.]|uniref:TlpA family protein disulfide reductase n=1 Tax=uncultured Marinobacter sp. TaxID=187379 RepID=UPI0030D7734D
MTSLSQTITVGPLGFTLLQALMLLALFVAVVTGALLGRKHRIVVSDALFTLVMVAFVAARLVFVLRYLDSYDGLLAMLDIRDGGFDIVAGIAAGLIYLVWRSWRSAPLRRPLAGAVLAGAITWGMLGGTLMLVDSQARPLPDLTLATLDEEFANLRHLPAAEGRPVVINLWATWCPPCVREMPVLAAAQKERDDIAFVFVNIGETSEQIYAFLENQSIRLDNILLDKRNRLGAVTGAHVLPTTLFYNADGMLVNSHTGELSRATLQRGLETLTPR